MIDTQNKKLYISNQVWIDHLCFSGNGDEMFMSYPSIPTDSLPQGRTNFTANVVWKASASVSEMFF